MNWVSSSLELAGSLLESVDQHAALTLAGIDEEEEQSAELLATARVSETSVDATASAADNGYNEDTVTEESSALTGGIPSSSSSSHTMNHATMTPPRSSSGKLAGLASAISTQLDNVSSGSGGEAPLSNSSIQSTIPPTEENCSRLQKELMRVKSELRVKEKQLNSAKRRTQICEEELVALEEECKKKIAEVQNEMSAMQQDKDSDEQNFIQALEIKDNQICAMKADITALAEAKALHISEIASLKAELAKGMESNDALWTSAVSANNESEQLIQSLRSELEDTLTVKNNLKREYDESKNTMYSRQLQLENANAQLANNVANLERELAKAREAAAAAHAMSIDGASPNMTSHFGANTNFASVNDDNRRVQQTLVLTKKALHDELRKSEGQKQEINALVDEVRQLKETLEVTRANSSRQLEAVMVEKEKLKEQVEQLTSHTSATAAANGELHIRRLTNRLIEKQETIDSLRSCVTIMDTRLQDVQLRAERAEEKLARVEQNGGIDDMEMAVPVGKNGGHSMRLRPNRMAHIISRVAPVVKRSHHVVTAIDVLDRWLLFLGRVFLQVPFARLGMMCYIALIHLWVFVILSFHTSHLTEEMQLSTAAEKSIVGPREEDVIPGGGH